MAEPAENEQDVGVFEDIAVKGEDLVAKVKELIHEGNVRRIIIKNDKGEALIEVPLTIGVVGALLLPVWAAIGALAALVADFTITIEREPTEEEGDTE